MACKALNVIIWFICRSITLTIDLMSTFDDITITFLYSLLTYVLINRDTQLLKCRLLQNRLRRSWALSRLRRGNNTILQHFIWEAETLNLLERWIQDVSLLCMTCVCICFKHLISVSQKARSTPTRKSLKVMGILKGENDLLLAILSKG